MEDMAYFPAIKIEKEQTLCGLVLFDGGNCMAARTADGSDRKNLYHRAVILQSYMVLDAWERKEQELLLAAGRPLMYTQGHPVTQALRHEKTDTCGEMVSFEHYSGIPERAGDSKNAVFWMAKALTEIPLKSRYLSLYHGLTALYKDEEKMWEGLKFYVSDEDAERFSHIIYCLGVEEVDLEERGTAYETPDFDPELFGRLLKVWSAVYRESRKEEETE